jgi:hypothetical protein
MHHIIIIDPFAHTIEAKEIQEISGPVMRAEIRADTMTRVRITDGIDLWVDDEGLVAPGQHYFAFADYPNPLAGRGLVAALTPDGNTVGLNIPGQADGLTTALKTLIRFIGDKHALEADILARRVARPEVVVTSNGKREVVWRWTPEQTPDDLSQANQAVADQISGRLREAPDV